MHVPITYCAFYAKVTNGRPRPLRSDRFDLTKYKKGVKRAENGMRVALMIYPLV